MADGRFDGRRILVVDDDANVLTVVGSGLRLCGCEVAEAEDGHAGLDLARTGDYDLIVLDISLPGLGGFEICRELKSDPKTAPVPVIFLSAEEEPKERVRGLRLGAIDYVVKPFDLSELVERIDIALRVKASRPKPPVPVESEPTEDDTQTRPEPLLPGHEFRQVVEERVQRLDPESGLLTLAFVRPDPEKESDSVEGDEAGASALHKMVSVLSDLIPQGALLGEVDSQQLGILIPRKNRYGAELLLDELRKRLESGVSGRRRIAISCGVAEYPNAGIQNAKELERTAESALRRALRRGGDQTVLL